MEPREESPIQKGSGEATQLKFWACLKTKYQKTSATAANSKINKIQNFQFNEVNGIESAWTKLKEYRRQLIAANSGMKHSYPDDALLLIFMNKLPDTYQSTIDGLYLQDSLSAEEKIQRLMEKEERIIESANLASRRRRPHKKPHRRYSDVSMKDISETLIPPSMMCYLCKGEHFQRHCPFVVEIQSFAEKLRLRHEKSDKSSNSRKSSQHHKGQGNVSKMPREKRSHGYSAQNDESGSEFEDTGSDTSTNSQKNNSCNEEPSATRERVHLSKELICKRTPAEWVFDTGATSPMTDQVHLFRGPLEKTKRVTVQVGGGNFTLIREERR